MRKRVIAGLVLVSGVVLFSDFSYAEGRKLVSLKEKLVCAKKTDVPPEIDGKIDESCWKEAAELKDFTLFKKSPFMKTVPAKEQTTGYLLYDDKNLYIAARCFESQTDKIKAEKKEKDSGVWGDDCMEVFISPQSAEYVYQIIVNSLGTIEDKNTAAKQICHGIARLKLA